MSDAVGLRAFLHRRGRWLWFAAGALAVILLVAGYVFLTRAILWDYGGWYSYEESGGPEGDWVAYAAAPAPDAAPEPAADPILTERQIVRDGYVEIRVDDVDAARRQVIAITAASGGFVTESSFYSEPVYGPDGHKRVLDTMPVIDSGRMRLRIPAESFAATLDEIAALGVELVGRESSARDVTLEAADYEIRLGNLRAVREEYLRLLGAAADVEEVLQVSDRLNDTRLEIELIEGRQAWLANQVALAVVDVRLERLPTASDLDPDGPLDAARAGWEASFEVLETLAEWTAATLAFSWWLIPPGAGTVALLSWHVKRRRRS